MTTKVKSSTIDSVANTQITGLINSNQINTVANTQITGLITSGQIASVANTQITGTISAVSKIQTIAASVGDNALTITLNPTSLDFRSPTLSSGVVNTRTVSSPISVTVPSTATLGTVNAVQSRLVVLAIDNAGTVELAVVNISGGNQLDETNLISTTAISAAADSGNVVYSTTARTNVPYRVVGYIESTQTTAGTWAAAPSTIQGYGGQALASMSALGYGQKWQNVAASRVAGTTYTNSTGRPIMVAVCMTTTNTAQSVNASFTIDGTVVAAGSANASNGTTWGALLSVFTFIIPDGSTYSSTASLSPSINRWWELR